MDLSLLPTATPIPGGLPRPGAELSPQQLCQVLMDNFPEDRSRPEGPDVMLSVVYALDDRLRAAALAMQILRDASSPDLVRCGSQAALDVLVGRLGRHTGRTAFSPGALPNDGREIADPGLALAIYEVSQIEDVRNQIPALLGDIGRWRQPSQRWDEIDAAVARGSSAVSSLDGRLPRLVGWALLARQADVPTAQQIGMNGIADAEAGRQALRNAMQAICASSDVQDGRCN